MSASRRPRGALTSPPYSRPKHDRSSCAQSLQAAGSISTTVGTSSPGSTSTPAPVGAKVRPAERGGKASGARRASSPAAREALADQVASRWKASKSRCVGMPGLLPAGRPGHRIASRPITHPEGPCRAGEGRRRPGEEATGVGRDASWCPTPGRARRSSRCRRAACATPTCTTGRAASTTTSRSCSATRRPAWSRRSGADVTGVAAGDFVILNWRAVCGNCRACRRGRPWYCFSTAQRHPEDDADRRHRAVARRSASARSPRRRSWPPASAPRSNPAAKPEAAGLLGCGVMAGFGAAVNTGERRPGRHRRRVRLRRRGRRRHRRGPAGRGAHDHRRRPRPQEARVGHGLRRHPHRRRVRGGPGGGGPRAHRGQRRRRVHRGGRATRRCCEQAFFARDLAGTVVQVGVPNPT